MERLLQYRFSSGRLKGQNMGNLFIAALTDIYGDFELAVEKLHDILRIKGKVIPVTSDNVTLCARLKNGNIIRGESQIPLAVSKMHSPISEVFLDPPDASPLSSAIDAILNADMIVLGPGSLYSSIIPNLLVDGITQAIAASDALKIYIANVMTQEGETEGYTVSDHIAAIFAHSAQGLFRLCLTNSSPIPKAVAARYAEEGAERIRCDKSACAALGVEVVERPVATVESGFVRHSSAALARELILLHAERSVRIAGARFRPREDAYQMEEQK